MVAAWNRRAAPPRLPATRPGRIAVDRWRRRGSAESDREAAVELVLSRLGAKRSAWNAADIRGQVEQWIAETGIDHRRRGADRVGRGPDRPALDVLHAAAGSP